jgi:tellurite resistance protein TerC
VIPEWLRIGSLCVMGLVIVTDLVLAYVRPHIPRVREAAIWITFYVVLALVFAGLLYLTAGGNPSGQFVAGWLTEYSLSIDNLFVFVIIMGRFSVPRKRQQGVLLVGIIIALVLRGVFILLGVALIDNFSWIFYLFGAFLLYTAIQQLVSNRDQTTDQESRVIRFLRGHLPITQTYDGGRLTTIKEGRRMLTPILVVFIAIGTTDLLFALDSIPAIFGITQDAFLVFAANVFALMGLRQLYFLLGHLIDRLAYLTYGIAAILLFIAVKLVFHAMHENDVFFLNGGKPIDAVPDFGTLTSLGVIVLALVVSIGASLIKLGIERNRSTKDPTDAA